MRRQLCFTIALTFFVGSTTSCSAQQRPVEAVNSPQTQTYGKVSEIGKLSEARASHSATLLASGKVLIAGGMERNGVFFDNADIFDPQTNSFTQPKGKMSIKRVSHTATLLPGGKVLIVGGWSNIDLPDMSAEIYDPQAETFKTLGNTNFRRSGHLAILLENGKVLLAGGFDGKEYLSNAEIFDPLNNSFTPIGKMQSARAGHTATELADGKILFTGGVFGSDQISSSAEIFDPKTNKFSLLKNAMTIVRYKHDAVRLLDGRVLILGGSDVRDWSGQYKSAEIYDPKTGEFKAAGDMNSTRFKIEGASVLLKDGKVFIGGGGEGAEVFDPQTNRFIKTEGNFGVPLHFASVTLLADGRALIVGGYSRGTRETGVVSTNRAWIFTL